MSDSTFAERCEAVFAPTHGRRWKSACAEALRISRATLYRYLDGTNAVPADVEATLEGLRPSPLAPVRDNGEMARLLAVAVVALRRALDADGWLKPPYHPDLQRCLDLCAARNVVAGEALWPATVAALLRSASRPFADWMPDTAWDPHGAYLYEPLLDGEQTTDTCRELAGEVEGHSVEDELVETRGYVDFRTECASQRDGQATYASWRRYVIEHPVNDGLRSAFDTMPDLANVVGIEEMFHVFYEPVPAAFADAGRVPLCTVSGTVLRRATTGGGFETESRDPEAVRRARAGEFRAVPWTVKLRMLKRPFRSFWCLPGKAEVVLMDRLAALGWEVEPWPELDRTDLVATSPDGARRVAVDVKDYASPTLLAARFDGFKGYERTHECYLAVPDARLDTDRTYARVFANMRATLGRKPVVLRSVSRLADELGKGR